ncbi:MAG: hypothetical protein J0I79_32795 [Mesorhizobium sp.]|uniref:hypothetical protein n=1 Tax=Mesorhizobium sp. TaxID=1871066 RepID=UPI001ACE62AD|nr:hypothetical protein [Mesorhizobium sp.]MBN9222736.1 hypothetical protein [Mesorhizobium sp.]
MALKARKPVAAKARSVREAQAKAGAERAKDAKPSFGKAAPRKVVPAAKAPAPRKAASEKQAQDTQSQGKQGAIRTVANIAAGAVVATARGAASLAASVIGKGGRKAKTK